MMYNIGLKLGPNILLFITHYIYKMILWNYINFDTYIYLWLCVLQLFLMNFVFNANLRIPKY